MRKVLYEPRRLRALAAHLSSIDVLMNLDPGRPIPAGDARIEPGAGPNWLVPATGRIAPPVLEAADRCDRIAALLLDTSRDLERIDLPAADRRHLLSALREEAAAWRARGAAWRAPRRPADVGATRVIDAHVAASAREYRHVARYLKRVDVARLTAGGQP